MSEELKQLIAWFENYQVTFNEIRLSECENIFDLSKYIDVHVRSVKRNWDNPTFASDILRLQRLKKVLENTFLSIIKTAYKTEKFYKLSNISIQQSLCQG